MEGEVEGTEDAEADLVEEAEEEVDTTPKKSLQEYLAEQEQKQKELDGAKKLRKANEGAEQKWNSEEKIEKTQEAYFESTHQKKSKAKAPKEKVFWKLMLFSLTSNHNHQEVVLEAEREVVPEAEEVTLEVAEVTLEVAPEATAEATAEVTVEVASEEVSLSMKMTFHPCNQL